MKMSAKLTHIPQQERWGVLEWRIFKRYLRGIEKGIEVQMTYTRRKKLIAYGMVFLLIVNMLSGSLKGYDAKAEGTSGENITITYSMDENSAKTGTVLTDGAIIKGNGSLYVGCQYPLEGQDVAYEYKLNRKGETDKGFQRFPSGKDVVEISNPGNENIVYELEIRAVSNEDGEMVLAKSGPVTFRFGSAVPAYSVAGTVTSGAKDESTGIYYAQDKITFQYTVDCDDKYKKLYRKVMNEANQVVKDGTVDVTSEDGFHGQFTESFVIGDSGFNEGTYTLTYYLKTEGEETLPEKSVTFVLDHTAPVLTAALKDAVMEQDGREQKGKIYTVTGKEKYYKTCRPVIHIKRKALDLETESLDEAVEMTAENTEKSLSFVKDGIYTVYTTAKDMAGNEAAPTEDVSFTIDHTAPVIEVSGIKNGEQCNGIKTLTLRFKDLTVSASDLNEEKDGTKADSPCRILVQKNNEKTELFKPVWSSVEGSIYESETTIEFGSGKTNENLFAEDASYKITIEGKDSFGNTAESKTISFVLDRKGPSIDPEQLKVVYEDETLGKPLEKTENDQTVYYFKDNAQLSFQIEESNYETTDLYIEESRDGGGFVRQKPYGIEDGFSTVKLPYHEEGHYTTRVWAKDEAGNFSGKDGMDANVKPEYIRHFVVDKTAPVFIIEGINENNQYCENGASLTIMAKDANPDPDTYRIEVQRTDSAGHTELLPPYIGADGWETLPSGDMCRKIEISGEGNYSVTVTGQDKAGNEGRDKDGNPATTAFRVDTEAPKISMSLVTDGAYYNNNVNLSVQIQELNYQDADARIKVTRQLGDKTEELPEEKIELSSVVSELSYVYDQEGYYTILVSAVDGAGNEGETKTIHFTVDKTAPVLSIEGVENAFKTREPVTLHFQAEDYNHDFSNYVISVVRSDVDGELESQNYVYPAQQWLQTETVAKKDVTFSEEGTYEITFDAVDAAKNTAQRKRIVFSIDHTAPVISGVTYTDSFGQIHEKYNNIYSNHAILVEFQVKDQVTGVKDQMVYVTIGGNTDRSTMTGFYPAHKTLGYMYYVYIPTDLNISELNDVITIRAEDMLDNEAHYTSANIVYNTNKPVIQMDCDVDYTKWTNKDVNFQTTVTDEVAGLKEVVYKIDNKVIKKVTFQEFTKTYRYELTATDSAQKVTGYSVSVEVTNNCGTSNTMQKQVYIDKVKPQVKLSGIENGRYYNTNQIFTTSVKDVSYKNTKTVYYITKTLDGRKTEMSAAVFKSQKYEDTCNRKMIKEGKYKIYAVTTDSAGNRSVSNTLTFVIDKTAPKLSITGVTSGVMSGTAVNLNFQCEESFFETNKVEINVERVLDGKTVKEEIKGFPSNAKKTSLSHHFTDDGTYKITMTATDQAGNTAAPQTIGFSVDQTKPVIRITGTDNYEQWDKPAAVQFTVEESYYSNNSVTIRGTKTDVDGNVTPVELPDFANTGKISSLNQYFEEDGIYEFEIVSKDEAGNRESGKIHFTIDRNKPEINGVSEYNGGYYQNFKLADSLEDVFKDLTVISYHIFLNGIEYDGVSDITEEGKYTLDIEVSDELGHINSEVAEFIIDHTAPKVIFSGAADGETVRESGTVTLSLTNSEDEITDVRMNGVHYGADVRSLSYSEYGSYQIDVDCIDKAGNAVTRSIYFVYSNPITNLIVFGGMGVLLVSTIIWLWVRTRRKEREEYKGDKGSGI